jgi:hypothetical protein
MDHVGIVVDDLTAATEFFVELGLELQGEGPVVEMVKAWDKSPLMALLAMAGSKAACKTNSACSNAF